MNLPYRFGRYVLLKKIAQGGMAEIFRAKYLGESGFSKDVCIKRLLPVWSDNPLFIKMLVDEAKALVHLSHPNIVQVFELGRDGKAFYISMEFVEGIDLKKLFETVNAQKGTLPPPFVFYVITEILKALRFAHQRRDEEGRSLNMVHRDISPQNVLLSFEGQVKVTDFGIAKWAHRSFETTQHHIKGKYSYMSPEQARGEKVDARADLYAVGILLFELLSRERLFEGVNDLATLELVREARLPDKALQNYPAPLRAVVFKALQKDPDYRYQNAKDFLEEVSQIVAQEKWETHAEEFSKYLKETFSNQTLEETVAEANGFAETVRRNAFFKRRLWALAASVATVLLSFSSLALWLHTKEKVRVEAQKEIVLRPPIVSEKIPLLGSVTIDAKPQSMEGVLKMGSREEKFKTPFHLGAIDIGEAKEGVVLLETKEGKDIQEKFVLDKDNPHWVKTFYSEPERPGILMVSARPWGEVTIPGVLNKKETPLTHVALKKGQYKIQVHYPPSDQWAEGMIQLASGGQVICQAFFGEVPNLTCR